MPRKGRKRLTIDIPEVIYNQLWIIADRRNITLTKLITRLIFLEIQKERELENK